MDTYNDEDLPKPFALGTEVELREVTGTVGGKPRVRIQHGRVVDRVWFYGLEQWGYAVRWDGSTQFDPGAFVIQPMLEEC